MVCCKWTGTSKIYDNATFVPTNDISKVQLFIDGVSKSPISVYGARGEVIINKTDINHVGQKLWKWNYKNL